MPPNSANLERFNALAADWDDSPLRAGIARAAAAAIADTLPLRRICRRSNTAAGRAW